MGFWKDFFGLGDEEENSKKIETGKKSDIDTTFVTSEEESDFSLSMFGQLEMLEADVDYIEEVLKESGANLRKQIELIRNLLLLSNNEQDPKVQQVFSELKTNFEEERRKADGEYVLRQLEQQVTSMDKMFETSIKNGGITKKKLEEYLEYIKNLQDKVTESDNSEKPILQNVRRQKFNEVSMKAEYRIKMLELMYLVDMGDTDINPFKNLSSTKQKMFSKYFFKDVKDAAKQYEYLSYSEDMFNATVPYYFGSIDKIAQSLNSQLENAVISEEFSIMELFDSSSPTVESFNFLKQFIKFKSTINEMADRKDELSKTYANKLERERKEEEDKAAALRKEQEKEEKRKAAEKQKIEKYKSMTDGEINAEIYKIEHDLKATGSRYINILEFQKEIARARGLLTGEHSIQSDALIYKTMNAIQVIEFIKKAKENGVNYTILPDSQEFDSNKDRYLVIVSQTDKDALNLKLETPVFNDLSYSSKTKDITFGQFPAWIINHLSRELEKDDAFSQNLSTEKGNDLLYKLSYFRKSGESMGDTKKREREVYNSLRGILYYIPDISGIQEKDLKDVMCYIEIPAVRNMLPILEQFKKAKVRAFLEPTPEKKRNTNFRDNIHIYFRREDLRKIEEMVLPEISGQDNGIARLKRNELNLAYESAKLSVLESEKALSEL